MRRGDRLADDPVIFSGLFWTGMRGVDLGLIDGLGDMRDVLKRRYGMKTRLELVSGARNLFGKRMPGVSFNAESIAAAAASGLADTAEEKALWSRFGL
jgi:ClpP class serine protease